MKNNVIKLFPLSLAVGLNKLECLFLAIFFRAVILLFVGEWALASLANKVGCAIVRTNLNKFAKNKHSNLNGCIVKDKERKA